MELLIHHAYVWSQYVLGLKSFKISEYTSTGGITHSSSTGTGAPVFGMLPDFALPISSSGCSSHLLRNWSVSSVSMGSVAALANYSDLKRKSCKSQLCSQTGQKLWVTGDLLFLISIQSEMETVLWDWALWDRTLSEVDGVRKELNCRTPAWCRAWWLHVGKTFPTLHDDKRQKWSVLLEGEGDTI